MKSNYFFTSPYTELDEIDEKFIYKFHLVNNSQNSIILNKIIFRAKGHELPILEHDPKSLVEEYTQTPFGSMPMNNARFVNHLIAETLDSDLMMLPFSKESFGYYVKFPPDEVVIYYSYNDKKNAESYSVNFFPDLDE